MFVWHVCLAEVLISDVMMVPERKKSKPACNEGCVSVVAQAHITDKQCEKNTISLCYI